jgi:D-arabinose 1-dehydrogenase-like Zn-dependent alcohol dehydrogenase
LADRAIADLATTSARRKRIQQINEAYERLVKSDVKYRFSIDMASLKA